MQVFIKVNHLLLEDAHEKLETISKHLEKNLTKKWKCLPSTSLPEEYNIVTLPYKRI
ncbi:MAG: hypothetical protein U9O24_08485 [Campylobacterota bacterium]|nr:hypothetical protein [Campylobacterota bacterium]